MNEHSELTQFLAGRDVACPECAYSLRGLKGEACPECGYRLELTVDGAEVPMRAFLATAIGLAMGFGYFLLTSTQLALSVLAGASGHRLYFFLFGLSDAFFGLSLALLLAKRRAFCAMPRGRRLWFAWLGGASPFLGLGAVAIFEAVLL